MRQLTLAALVLLWFTSCTHHSTESDTLSTGDLHGNVNVRVTNEIPFDDQSGVKVIVEGTSFNAVTDANGEWTIADLPSATYNLSFVKEGFGMYREMAYAHLGGAPSRVPGPIEIFKMPTCAPVFDSVMDKIGYLKLNCHVPCLETGSLVALYFGSSREVSHAHGKYAYTMIGHGGGATTERDERLHETMFCPAGSFARCGLDPTDSIYVVAYTLGGYSSYVDPVSKDVIYPAMYPQPSRVVGFKWH